MKQCITKHFQQQLKAFSMMELLLVLAISTTLIVMTVGYFRQVQQNSKITATINLIGSIAAAGREYFQGQGTTSDINDFVDADLINRTQVRGPWGGDVTISSSTDQMTITAKEIPTLACNNIVRALDGIMRINEKAECDAGNLIVVTNLT